MLPKSQCLCSEEETEAKHVKSVHCSGNKRVSMVTLLKGPGVLCPVFLCLFRLDNSIYLIFKLT
ncbi:hypothetical protein E2636_04675 [Paenisporosarcina antarctica]|uniref:Uncharacterized protein n=1 Tax=Paenisporosarcina antarctica TaxID=417367 RepID=A0A4V1AMU2_9BACL|nr:hypothetical protein E2636_04675 [Paenisporosarcina antarctica]